jgi:hypothetical protein
MNRTHILGILACLATFLCQPGPLVAQARISFRAFAGEGIVLSSPQGLNAGLDFNAKRRIIVPKTDAIRINLTEGDPFVVYQIKAAEGFDLLVDLDTPRFLELEDEDRDPEDRIPFVLRVAYENSGAATPQAARGNAVELPVGVNSLLLPVGRRSTGAPGPPPDPFSGDFSRRPTGTVYLFLYGELGPFGNIRAGTYSKEVTIHVNYADYPSN